MAIIIILIFSFVLRLIGINQSLWLDEAISVNIAKLPIDSIVTRFSIHDFHPPLYYWFLNIWIKIFGDQVWVMRLSSILFSLITIWLVYKIGKEIKDQKTGLWAAILTGINPLLIYFSQELRMYSLVTMWLIASICFLVKMLKKPNWKNILGFNIMTGLSFVTFYGSIFLIGAEILYILINKKIKLFLISVLGIILALLGISPLLSTQLKYSQEALLQVSNWGLALGKVNLKNLLLIPLKFSVGKISWWPKINYYVTSGLWSLVVFGITLKSLFKNKLLRFLLIVPLVFGIIFSLKSPMLQYFRFLYLIPIISLIISLEAKKNIKIFLTIGFLIFSGIYLINPKMHRENWKDLASSLSSSDNVYMLNSFADPINFYNPNLKINAFEKSVPIEDNIKIIPYGEAIHGFDHTRLMQEQGYVKTEEKDFGGVTWEEWISSKQKN